MGKNLTLGCKVKPRGVPKIWPISETGRANILKYKIMKSEHFTRVRPIFATKLFYLKLKYFDIFVFAIMYG